MAVNNQDLDTQSRWKSRYYEALGEIEERETAWRDAEGLLRRLVSSLTQAADDRHRDLNRNLNELRNAMRDGQEFVRLHDLVDRINEQVNELDEIRAEEQETPQTGKLLLDVMDRLQLQDTHSREIRQIRKQIAGLKPGDDSSEVCGRLTGVLKELMGIDDDLIPERSRKQKLLDRILMRQERVRQKLASEAGNEVQLSTEGADTIKESTRKPSQKLMAPAVGDLLLQLALRLPNAVKRRINFPALKKHTNRARKRKDLIAIIDVIAQNIDAAYLVEEQPAIILDDDSASAMAKAIHQVLAQMHPPQDLREKIGELEKFFDERHVDVEALIHCLNSLSQVVAEICRRLAQQRDDLEGFFIQLGLRLEEIDRGLQKTGALYSELHQENLRVDRAVQDQVRDIHEAMQTDNDIVRLKSAVQIHLGSIEQYLQEFRDLEKRQYEQAQGIMAELGSTLDELETDGSGIKDRLQETQKLSMYDALTGLPNRQFCEERLASEVARCKRYGTALSMIVCEIDRFDALNESYGYAGGDRVLKFVAETLDAGIRETDYVSHYEAAEFVILMPETMLDSARQAMDKLRNEIEQSTFEFHGTRVNVTVSAGVAQYSLEEVMDSLFDRTDVALQSAKQEGGNRVRCAMPEKAGSGEAE